MTHHTIGEGVTGLRHRQALDRLWGHPGKSAHQRHVCCVREEPRCPEITDLKGMEAESETYYIYPIIQEGFITENEAL